ncbi:DUF2812 domain-containing protein [Cohnella endophytica]|uniref:DUF2812 domain-containing protein n=1 Tax=Cohnella endophytica TaxID=2419778 RepID=A0A494XBP1_9BACL|nr:DUF2812 domain-containing protein [Cohnella endophytica]RKP47980.1 DUF2812 domain-containing protein [Cohnella endophytica]
MEPRREKRVHLFFSWNYEQEEERLNELSLQGWHFEKAGAIKGTFVQDKTIRYTYRLDYQTGLKAEKKEEYVELYRDAGWEYVNSYGAMWHYYRRPWEPGDQPRLYSDRESLAALYMRIQKVMAVMLLVNFVILSANLMNWLRWLGEKHVGFIIPVIAIYLLVFGLLGYGVVKMGKKAKAVME